MKKILLVALAMMIVGVGAIDAQNRKRAPRKAAKKENVAAKFDASAFNGTFANSYSDGIGGTVTDYLTLVFDEATGTATGEYKNERGEKRNVEGKLQGNKLICKFTDDGDDFADILIYSKDVLKLEGFTGTFKRVSSTDVKPAVDIEIPVQEAPVDPAYELIKDRVKK